jgi:hypothetical protein
VWLTVRVGVFRCWRLVEELKASPTKEELAEKVRVGVFRCWRLVEELKASPTKEELAEKVWEELVEELEA